MLILIQQSHTWAYIWIKLQFTIAKNGNNPGPYGGKDKRRCGMNVCVYVQWTTT